MSSMNESPQKSKEIDVPLVDLQDINVPDLPNQRDKAKQNLIEKEEEKEDIKEEVVKNIPREAKDETPDGSSKENSQEIKLKATKKKKKDNVFLELGQFIEIEASSNEEINKNNYQITPFPFHNMKMLKVPYYFLYLPFYLIVIWG